MEAEGRAIEVNDLRTLVPVDEEMIYQGLRRTSRVVVLHEDSLSGGFGAEIMAGIPGNAMDLLDAPVSRVAALDSFVQAAPNLE